MNKNYALKSLIQVIPIALLMLMGSVAYGQNVHDKDVDKTEKSKATVKSIEPASFTAPNSTNDNSQSTKGEKGVETKLTDKAEANLPAYAKFVIPQDIYNSAPHDIKVFIRNNFTKFEITDREHISELKKQYNLKAMKFQLSQSDFDSLSKEAQDFVLRYSELVQIIK